MASGLASSVDSGLIVVRLRGRLGNHLFQFALGRALTPDGPVVVDNLRRSEQSLSAALVAGAIRVATTRESLRLRQPPHLPRGRLKIADHIEKSMRPGPVRRWLQGLEYHESREGVVDRAVFELTGPLLVNGYFQNEGYFSDIADAIVGQLRHPGPVHGRVLDEFRAKVGPGTSVAIVVRAGLDYEELGWVQRFDWYRRAAEQVTANVGSPRFAVFSDIPVAAEAVAAALGDLGPATPIARIDPLSQLHLISAMDHAVISATSFGWWGAWLGDHRCGFAADRIVIAPDPWIRSDLDSTPSVRWRRLEK